MYIYKKSNNNNAIKHETKRKAQTTSHLIETHVHATIIIPNTLYATMHACIHTHKSNINLFLKKYIYILYSIHVKSYKCVRYVIHVHGQISTEHTGTAYGVEFWQICMRCTVMIITA